MMRTALDQLSTLDMRQHKLKTNMDISLLLRRVEKELTLIQQWANTREWLLEKKRSKILTTDLH